MAGSDRYSLLVESQTRGEAELRRYGDSLDRLNSTLDKFQQRQQSNRPTVDPLASLRKSAGDIRSVIESPLQSAGKAVEGFVLKFGAVGSVAAGVAVGVALGGKALFDFVSTVGSAAEGMQNLADRTGLSLSQVDRFQAMAAVAGVNVEALAVGGRTLAKVLEDTGREGADARKSMQDFGLSLYDSQGNIKELGGVLEGVLSKLSNVKDESRLLAETTKLLGKGGTELLPLIRNFQELDRVAKDLGFGSRNQLLQDLARADDAIDKLGLRWEILKTKLAEPASAVVTVITSVVDAFASDKRNIGATAGRSFAPSPTQAGLSADVQLLLRGRAAIAEAESQAESRRRSQLAAGFTTRLSGTEDGRQQRLRDIEADRAKLIGPLQSGSLDPDAFKRLNSQFSRLGNEKASIEAALKASQALPALRKQINDFVLRSVDIAADGTVKALDQITRETVELLAKAPRGEQSRILAASVRLSEAELSKASSARFERIAGDRQTSLELEAESAARRLDSGRLQQAGGVFLAVGPNAPMDNRGLIEAGKARTEGIFAKDNRELQRRVELLSASTDYQVRLVELLAGPGGEFSALERITALRIQQIDLAQQLGASIDAQAEKTKVLQDAEIRRLEIVKQQRDAFKESIGRGFDALVGGGASGLRAFGISQITGQLRTVATNLGGELFSGSRGRFTLPGQRTADGTPTFIGRLLSGTIAADSGLKTSTDLNTQATMENTRALLTVGGGGTVAAGGSGLSSILGLPAGVFRGSGSNPLVFSAVPTLPPGIGTPADSPILTGKIPGFPGATGASPRGFLNQYGSTAVTAGVYAAALAGGAVGVTSGIKQGGLRGGLTAVASGLGAAAALDPEPVSKAVLAIASVAAGIATQYLPDPKKAREKQIDQYAEAARFSDPGSSLFEFDMAGRTYDTNIRGDVRPMVSVNVQAIDSRSFIDHAEAISDAVMVALDDGHRLSQSVRYAALNQ